MHISDDISAEGIAAFRRLRSRAFPVWDIVTIFAGALAAFILFPFPDWALIASWWYFVVTVIRSDLDHFLIPNWASAGIAFLALVGCFSVPDAWLHPQVGIDAALASMLHGLVVLSAFWLIGWIYQQVAGREGIGFGDVKLAAASALWLEPMEIVLGLELAALAALCAVLVLKLRRHMIGRLSAIPFGAFLAPAMWIIYIATRLNGIGLP